MRLNTKQILVWPLFAAECICSRDYQAADALSKERFATWRSYKQQHGFTLIELSIVLVIIGLIVGGVLVGQDLIESAKIRAVVSEHQQFETAAHTFRVKYDCMPGDCSKATTFFGSRAGGNCLTTPGAGTCDGNGDKQIISSSENHYFWEHLSEAELIEGDFSGVRGPGGSTDYVGGQNAPKSAIENNIWSISWLGNSSGNSNYIAAWYGNALYLMSEDNLDSLTPVRAWLIDSKLDDGLPSRGRALAYRWSNCIDTATANPFPDATYNLDYDVVECALVFPKAVN